MHLGEVAQMIRAGIFGKIDVAVIEAVDVTSDGRVFLTAGIVNAPTFLEHAKKIIIERNSYFSSCITEFANNLTLLNPPKRPVIPLYGALYSQGWQDIFYCPHVCPYRS